MSILLSFRETPSTQFNLTVMKIKTKLNLGVGLLLALIMLLALVGAYFIFSIKKDTQDILKANYNTLEYSRNMLMALDAITPENTAQLILFESNLAKQIDNITETGEGKATENLKHNFLQLKQDTGNQNLKSQVRQDIFRIMKLNMDAIKKKSDIANKTAEGANLAIAATGSLCFLIAFSLFFNLPSNIANPIKELTESIRQIANKNYSERVNFTSNSEFGELARSFNTMALKLQEYHNSNLYKLSFEKKRLETLINNMHDPIVGMDSDGIILFANEEALKIFGIKQEDLIGKDASEVARYNDLLQSLIGLPETARPKPMKIFADGKESYFEPENVVITITPTGEEKQLIIGNVLILRNITVFKELDFAKTNFIATVSHELKTPISAIKFSLQLLENDSTGLINTEQKQLIESIKDDTERLLKITSELLELSQLETGNIQLSIEKSSPYQIIAYATEAVRKEAERKQIEISIETAENLPDVKADGEKTAWVLVNFLTNAIRYSSEHSKVTVSLRQENHQLVFTVSDKGKGIESRYKKKVFDKYFQIPGSPKSGTGLGLAISREFIEAQNGIIGLESELGLGSTFYFKLDVA